MRFLIEVGKIKSAKGWLTKMEADEILSIVRELQAQGVRDIHIYDAESFAGVTQKEVEIHLRSTQRRH